MRARAGTRARVEMRAQVSAARAGAEGQGEEPALPAARAGGEEQAAAGALVVVAAPADPAAP